MKEEINSCDGGHETTDEVRVLPISKNGGNVIVCRKCFFKEIDERIKRHGEDATAPKWRDLTIYKSE